MLFIKIFFYICTNKQKQIKFTIMTNLKTLDTHRAQQITDKLQEGEKVKEQIRNVSLCFLFFALIILAPFIESIFNLSI